MIAVIPFTPHVGQIPILESKARFREVSCGRRWGKTALMSADGIAHMLAGPDLRGWIVTPIFKQVAEVWDANPYSLLPMLRAAERENEIKVIADESKTERRIKLLNGSVLECRTGESDENLRGAGLDWLGIDEAGQLRRSSWYSVRPALDDRRGRALLVGTPQGRNWFWEEWLRGWPADKGGKGEADYESWQMPSSSAPHFDADMWAAAKRSMPGFDFAREYQAEFLQAQAAVFTAIDRCIVPGDFEPPVKGRMYVHGLDLAKQHDWTVLTTLDVVTAKVVNVKRLQKIAYGEQAAILAPLTNLVYPGEVFFDATGGGIPVEETLRVAGMRVHPVTFTAEVKTQLVRNLQVRMEAPGGLQIPANPVEAKVMVDELRAYESKVSPLTGKQTFNAPEGQFDDCVMSLALAAWGLQRGASAFMAPSWG